MTLFVKRVAANGDDTRQHSGTTFSAVSSANIHGFTAVSWETTDRFTNVTIPQGAIIVDAKLQWKAFDNFSGNTCNFTIRCNDVDNAVAPTNSGEFNALVLTTAIVNNNNVAGWTAETVYDSPDLATIVQEIVSRPGWASGNAMQFVMQDNGSSASANRNSYTHDGDSAKAAYLVVNYTLPTSGFFLFF